LADPKALAAKVIERCIPSNVNLKTQDCRRKTIYKPRHKIKTCSQASRTGGVAFLLAPAALTALGAVAGALGFEFF